MMKNSPEDWTLNEIVLFVSLAAVGAVFVLVVCCVCVICGSCSHSGKKSKHWERRGRGKVGDATKVSESKHNDNGYILSDENMA